MGYISRPENLQKDLYITCFDDFGEWWKIISIRGVAQSGRAVV